MKFKSILVVTALCTSMILSGCGGGSEEAVATEAPATTESAEAEATEAAETGEASELIVWNAGISDADDSGVIAKEDIPFNKYNAQFLEANPGTTLNVSRYNMDQMSQLILAASMSDDLPDVMFMWAGSPTNDFSELLLNLEDYMTPEEIAEYTGLDICRSGMTPSGHLQALPLVLTTYNIYYNKAVCSEVGLATEPATWQEFLDACQVVKDGGKTPILMEGSGSADTWALSEFLADEIGPEGVSTIGTDAFKFTDPAFINSYNEWKKIFDQGYVNEDYVTVDNSTLDSMFLNGDAAFRFGGSWGQKDLLEMMGDNVGTFPIPAVRADAPFKETLVSQPGMSATVCNTTEQPELAVDYIQMITSGAYQTEECVVFGGIPSNKKADISQIQNPLTLESYSWVAESPTAIGFDSLIPAEAANWFYKNSVVVDSGDMTPEELAMKIDEITAQANE